MGQNLGKIKNCLKEDEQKPVPDGKKRFTEQITDETLAELVAKEGKQTVK